MGRHLATALDEYGDVPTTLRCDGREMPLGRYMRQKLQKELGVSDEIKQKKLEIYQKELLSMRDAEPKAQAKEFTQEIIKGLTYSWHIPAMPLKEFLVMKHAPKIAKMERIQKQQQLRKSI